MSSAVKPDARKPARRAPASLVELATEAVVDALVENQVDRVELQVSRLPEDIADRVLVGLRSRHKLTDHTLPLFFNPMRWHLSLRGATNIRKSVLRQLAFRSPSLRELNLADCRQVNNVVVRNVLQNCNHLQSLSIAGCRHVTDPAFQPQQSLFQPLRACMSLEALDFSRCSQITDRVVELLAKTSPNLRALDFSHCKQVTSVGVRRALGYFEALERIAACFAARVDDDAFPPTDDASEGPVAASPPPTPEQYWRAHHSARRSWATTPVSDAASRPDTDARSPEPRMTEAAGGRAGAYGAAATPPAVGGTHPATAVTGRATTVRAAAPPAADSAPASPTAWAWSTADSGRPCDRRSRLRDWQKASALSDAAGPAQAGARSTGAGAGVGARFRGTDRTPSAAQGQSSSGGGDGTVRASSASATAEDSSAAVFPPSLAPSPSASVTSVATVRSAQSSRGAVGDSDEALDDSVHGDGDRAGDSRRPRTNRGGGFRPPTAATAAMFDSGPGIASPSPTLGDAVWLPTSSQATHPSPPAVVSPALAPGRTAFTGVGTLGGAAMPIEFSSSVCGRAAKPVIEGGDVAPPSGPAYAPPFALRLEPVSSGTPAVGVALVALERGAAQAGALGRAHPVAQARPAAGEAVPVPLAASAGANVDAPSGSAADSEARAHADDDADAADADDVDDADAADADDADAEVARLHSQRPAVAAMPLRRRRSSAAGDSGLGLCDIALSGCPLSDRALLRAAARCPLLVRVRLGWCLGVTGAGVSALARACPRLEDVDLRSCAHVGDDGVRALAACPALRRVNLQLCTAVSGDAVVAMVRACPLLSELSVESVPGIEDAHVLAILGEGERIKTLIVKGCRVSEEVLREMKRLGVARSAEERRRLGAASRITGYQGNR